ncbi:MAG: hypothetical protein ACE5KT_12415 [Methanosarcinales archaeon]
MRDYKFVEYVVDKYEPEAIIHLGEQPSAPYSMIDEEHFEIEYRGRRDSLPFPRQAGSFYHLTKVHDTHNIIFACKIWGLCSTDIMQGVVYGTRTDEIEEDERLRTRFDFDGVFGTAINRYCAQAVIGHPLTPYGIGHQKRGFIALRDSIQCLTIALKNPPKEGEYRTFNQFDEVYNVTELAEKVKEVAGELGIKVEIKNIENPRVEAEEHYYNPDHEHLRNLGFKPRYKLEEELKVMLEDLIKYKSRIIAKKDKIEPKVKWKAK